VAAAAGGVLYGLTYVPAFFIDNREEYISYGSQIGLSFLSNIAMTYGCKLLGVYEARGGGLTWGNFYKPPTKDTDLTFLHVLTMLFFDSIIYMLLTFYLENVFPGQYGTPLKWNFPFKPSYWRGLANPDQNFEKTKYSTSRMESARSKEGDVSENMEFFEEEPTDSKCIVKVNDLSKTFKLSHGKTKKAVRQLNFNMYENEIFVLLGHNGAGKTTTMSMLTGFIPCTSGDAVINGHSIRTNISGVRTSMGLCPQFNILFGSLTVDEHFYFFSRLKGLNDKESKAESKKMQESLDLTEKKNFQSHQLSGGMKRKLSVGIALCAGSKYVILDEPTSGMDPSARRELWEVLEHYKNQCTILLTTHYMDEADYLGNRIAIMNKGKIRCSGSPLFLKNKFGVGYHVVLTKLPHCDVEKLKSVFTSHVPEAVLEKQAGAELSFLLPFNTSSAFPALFKTLDDQQHELAISGYGATITTLEEVFLRVNEDGGDTNSEHEEALSSPDPIRKTSHSSQNQSNNAVLPSAGVSMNGNSNKDQVNELMSNGSAPSLLLSGYEFNQGAVLWGQQFWALFLKRWIHFKRNYKHSLWTLITKRQLFIQIMVLMNWQKVTLINLNRITYRC